MRDKKLERFEWKNKIERETVRVISVPLSSAIFERVSALRSSLRICLLFDEESDRKYLRGNWPLVGKF